MRHGLKILLRPFGAAARKVLGTITHVATQDPVAALTFDDGPHPEFTPRLLDILEKHNAHATFFMVGEAAQRYPQLVRAVARAGHAIGNHSWDHPSFPSLSGRERRQQILACAAATAPYAEGLFRPPWGLQSVGSNLHALWLGYQVVTWNVVAGDWLPRKPEDMAGRLITSIEPGSIVLLHDAIYRSRISEPQWNRQPMLEAINIALTHLNGSLRFITLPRLLRHGNPIKQHWFTQEALF